jgi:hypothetical protein
MVAIEILSKDEWTAPSSVVLEDISQDDDEESIDNTKVCVDHEKHKT